MSEIPTDRVRSKAKGSFAVPVGAVLLFVCFFLPWVDREGFSGLEVSGDAVKAESTFQYLHLRVPHPLSYTRLLFLIPVLALATLLVGITVGPGHPGRLAVRLSVFAWGAMLSVFFLFCGVRLGGELSYGFWGSLTGALYVCVGALLNVFRNE